MQLAGKILLKFVLTVEYGRTAPMVTPKLRRLILRLASDIKRFA